MSEPPKPRKPVRHSGRTLVQLQEALRPLGLNATLYELAQAIGSLKPRPSGKWALAIPTLTIQCLLADLKRQAIMNEVIMEGCKERGWEVTYRELYPLYVSKCEDAGLTPFTLKTFQNRALQREARWERRLSTGKTHGR